MTQVFLPPPQSGWNTHDPVTMMDAAFAPIFDNFVIENGAVTVRRGHRVWATGLNGRVDGLLPWNPATGTRRLFACAGGEIHDVTTAGPVGTPVQTGATSARWDSIIVNALGGTFLFAFNGVDQPKTYNGSTWAAWTATNVPATSVAWAHQFKGRLFVGHPGAMSFWYGAPGAIAGAFTEFPLRGMAAGGGGICAATSLSGDGGSGPDDLLVLLTTEGEGIVFAGIDPDTASSWSLVGRWRLPRPVGAPHRNVLAWGGDALALTEDGLLPLSALRSGLDAATVSTRAALTRAIAPTWRALTREYGANTTGWSLLAAPRYGVVVTNVPWGSASAQQIVVSGNGALSRWYGLRASVWCEALGGRVFFGDIENGQLLLWGEDTADQGEGLRAEAMTAYAHLRAPAQVLRGQLMQVLLRNGGLAIAHVAALSDWHVPRSWHAELGSAVPRPPLPPLPAATATITAWSQSSWSQCVWGGADQKVARKWRAAPVVGHGLAVRLRLVAGRARPAWLGANVVFERGGPVR